MTKKNIALVTGGDSGESVISLKSAQIIKENIDLTKFNVYTILIKGAEWLYLMDSGEKSEVNKNDFSIIENQKKVIFDAVFIAIHGTPGEDGKLQGYFDMLKIPYTFSGVTCSSITFNKSYCQLLAKSYGATTAKSVLIKKGEKIKLQEILHITGLPCFVKPNNGGSSIGMSKVTQEDMLEKAILTAFEVDSEVQIEEYIQGTEVTCGILQKKNELIALPLTEIRSKREFFDYTSKYDPSLAEEITPANVKPEIHAKCKEISLHLFKKFDSRGVSRFYYIIKEDTPYFLEVNTIPGLSAASIVPKQAGVMGIPLKELFTILIENAL